MDSIKRALSGFLLTTRGQKREADDKYEEDGFIVPPKRIHAEPVNGQIGPYAGHEYEEEEVAEETQDEEILTDPSDLFDSSESESEPDLTNDFIPVDRPRARCFFVDDEAAESDGSDNEDAKFSTADEGESDATGDSDSDRDPAIRSPLRKADFVESEAIECNDITQMYDGLVGQEEMSDDQHSSDSDSENEEQEKISDQSEDDDEHDEDDEDYEIVFHKKRRHIVISDSDEDSESLVTANSGIGSVTDENVSLTCEDRVPVSDCPEKSCTSVSQKNRPFSLSLIKKKKRFLELRQRVKQWRVSDL